VPSVNLTVDQYTLLVITLALFAFLGLRRGVNRELLFMAGIALAIFVADPLASALQPQVNRFYKLGHFALGGGLVGEDPTAAWRNVRDLPDLIRSPGDAQLLLLIVFVLIALIFYLWGQHGMPTPGAIMPKVLGLLAGGINGFLIAYFLFPLLFPQPATTITLPSTELNATLSSTRTLAWVAVFFVLVLIAFGLYGSTGPKRK
jgi:hypothetical protein